MISQAKEEGEDTDKGKTDERREYLEQKSDQCGAKSLCWPPRDKREALPNQVARVSLSINISTLNLYYAYPSFSQQSPALHTPRALMSNELFKDRVYLLLDFRESAAHLQEHVVV